jgi:uncharacterized protein (TIGR02611 family)
MRSPIKRLFSRWKLDNIKVVRRVIVSVVGATVVLIGIALLVLPGPAFVVIPVGLAILATEYAWARRWLRKVRAEWRATLSPVGSERQFAILCHRIIAASTRNAQPAAPNANCQAWKQS